MAEFPSTVRRYAGHRTVITKPPESPKDYEREITVSPQPNGGVNVSVQLYGHNGPLGAGLTLDLADTGELVAAIGRALANAHPVSETPEGE